MREDSIRVPLTRGKVAVIDVADAPVILAYRWCYATAGYAVRRRRISEGPGPEIIYMHRQLLGLISGEEVDHVNGDKLDNRRANLRKVTSSQNGMNRRIHSNNTTGFRGVYRHRTTGKWYAAIQVDGKQRYLKLCDTPEEAAKVRDEAARVLHGEYARLNDPNVS